MFYHLNATALQRKAHPPTAPQPLDFQQPPLSPPLCPVPTHPAPLRCPQLKWTFSSKVFQAPRLGSFPDPRFGNRMEAPGILWTLELFSASAPLFRLPATPVRPSSPCVCPLVCPHPPPSAPHSPPSTPPLPLIRPASTVVRTPCPPLFRAPPTPPPRSTPRPPRGATQEGSWRPVDRRAAGQGGT